MRALYVPGLYPDVQDMVYSNLASEVLPTPTRTDLNMAKMPEYALMYVRVAIPPTHTAEQAADEVRKSIGFGQPFVKLLGKWEYVPTGRGQQVVVIWTPASGSPAEVADMIIEAGPEAPNGSDGL